MEESCKTCKHRYKLHKSVYSHNGCEHSEMEGFVCMCFANEGIAEWMTGAVEEYGICEAYQPRDEKRCIDFLNAMDEKAICSLDSQEAIR